MRNSRNLSSIFIILSIVFIALSIILVIHLSKSKLFFRFQKEPTFHQPKEQTLEHFDWLQTALPNAQNFSKKSGFPPHHKAYAANPNTGQNQMVGIVFMTNDIVPKERGYAGPMKIVVGVDLKGKISQVRILEHSETPSYIGNLEDFTNQFSSMSINSPFQLGEDIDGITGATITHQAVARAIRKSLRIIAADLLASNSTDFRNLFAEEMTPPIKIIPFDQILIPIILFLIAILGFVFKKSGLRWFALLGGFVYLGLVTHTMFSVIHIANIGLGKIPFFLDSPLWHVLIGLVVATTLILGNIYCSSICPFGALQELISNLTDKFRLNKINISPSLDQKARHVKYIVLGWALALSLLLQDSTIALFEPYVLLFSMNASKLGWAFVALMLILSIFHFRFWCKYFCPIGAFNGLLANLSLYKIRLTKGHCGDCEICANICPTRAIKKKNDKYTIDYPECILCGKCMKECPQGVIQIAKPFYEKTK